MILSGELQFDKTKTPEEVFKELKDASEEAGGLVRKRTPNAKLPFAIIVEPKEDENVYFVLNMDHPGGKITDIETFTRTDALALDSPASLEKHIIKT